MTTTAAAKTGELVKKDHAVAQIEQMIAANKGQMTALLGKNISTERLFQIAMTAVSRVPDLAKCTTASVLGCVMESARLRLPAGVGAGGTWLIPRENKVIGAKECTLIIDYRAIILMMQRDAGVGTVIAEAVCDKDPFKYGIRSDGPFLEWEPAKGNRGPIIGYVAASWSKKDNRLTGVIYKTVQEIKESSMAKSPAAVKGDGPWVKDPEWMYKKSVIRPLAKLNPGTESDDLSRAVSIDERADLGLPQNLHLLADPSAAPHPDAETKTYAPAPSPTGKEPTPAEKLAWAKDAAGKQGVPGEQFDAWVAEQPGDEAAKAEAATVAWKRVAKKEAKAVDVFVLKKAASEPAGEKTDENEATFGVASVATTDFVGEAAIVIRDTSEPQVKYFTTDTAVSKAAKTAKENKTTITVKWVEKTSGDKAFRWISTLA